MELIDNIDLWQEDKERLILYADIMGFKDTIFSQKMKARKEGQLTAGYSVN